MKEREIQCRWCRAPLVLRQLPVTMGPKVWRWCHPAGRRADCLRHRQIARMRALEFGIRRARAERPFLPF